MTLLTRLSFCSSLLLCFSASAGAQSMNLVEGREILNFARGLASQYSFVDLAAEVLADGEKRGFPSSMREEVAIEKCGIFSIGALAMRDATERHKLFEDALQAYTDFIDQNSRSDALPEAQAGFILTSGQFAQSMLAELDNAKGEDAEKLRVRRIEVLSDAVSRTGELIDNLQSLEDPGEADKRRLYDLMLNRGRMLTETARNQEDPTFSFEQAMITLEELTFEAGEGSPYALRAFDAMGNNLVAQGMPQDAAYMFQYVVNSALPIDIDDWNTMVEEQELSQADKDTRWLFVELSTRGLVESFSEAGDLEEALVWAMHFYNTLKREGFTLSVPGHLSMLQVSRTLLDAGGFVGGSLSQGDAAWFATEEAMEEAGHRSSRKQRSATDLALTIAQSVKEDNRGNSLQVRAQKLIKDIISQPGVKKSPDVLMDAALGEYNEQNWPEAIEALKEVLSAIAKEDDATQKRYGPDLMYYLGRSYRGEKRYLEAALSFKEGLDNFLGDDAQNAQNAKGYLSSIKRVSSTLTGEDANIDVLKKSAEQALIKHGAGDTVGALLFSRAEKQRRDKNYDEAVKLYKQIEAGDDYFEKALVTIGVCELRKGNADAAIVIFDDYLGNYVEDPKNAIAQSETRKTRRKEAMASSEFYRGYIYFKRADKKPASDPNWAKVIELLATYYTDYPEQERLAPATMRFVALAHLTLGDVPKARAVLDAMLERFPSSQFTGAISIAIYKKLKADQGAAIKAGDTELATSLLLEMARLLKSGNATAPEPSFDNLRSESRHWLELGDTQETERVLLVLRDKFAGDRPDDMVKYILPDLAQTYMDAKRVSDALEVLRPLNAEGLKPSKAVVRNYCRAVTGWVIEGENGRPTIVPGGTQDTELLGDACTKLAGIRLSAESWSAEWTEYQFDLLFGYYAWSKIDSSKTSSVRSRLDGMINSTLVDDTEFMEVEKALKAEGGELDERLGNNVLRKRYVWLNQLVGR